jgi:hypothetical protein
VVYGMHIIRCTFRNELFLFRESLAFVPCSLAFVPCRCSSKNTYPGAQSFIVRGYLLCEQVHSEDPRKYQVIDHVDATRNPCDHRGVVGGKYDQIPYRVGYERSRIQCWGANEFPTIREKSTYNR